MAATVWIVSGEHDIDPTRDRRLAGSLGNSTFELVPGAGHHLPLEAPDALASITARAVTTVD